MLVPRSHYLRTLERLQDKPVIKILSGLRRTGKSTLLRLMQQRLLEQQVPGRNILYINKESLQFDSIRNYQDLHQWVAGHWEGVTGARYLFIDEVQEIEDWERAVVSFHSENLADIYLTGSNAHLLSMELATLLSGRYMEIPVQPLTFAEFRDFRKAGGISAPAEADFELFLKFGGLPGIHALELSDDVALQYLQSLFHSILYKDILLRHGLRDPSLLERIARFAFDNCGNITTAKRIADYLKSQRMKVSLDTVLSYLGFLSSAFILRKVSRFDIKGRRILELYDKFYMGDIGLRHGFMGYRGGDISGLLENVVFLELLHRGYDVHVGKGESWEIDFVARRREERLYIQVCYLLADTSTVEREFRPLEAIRDNHPKLVLSMDRHWAGNREGIGRGYLPDFLLEGQP